MQICISANSRELDGALLRRLGRRVFIDLPDLIAREEIIRTLIPARQDIGNGLSLISHLDYSLLAQV